MLQGVTRQLRLQYAMRKDVLWLAGMGAFYFSADHLVLQRTENKLRALGLIHDRNLCGRWTNMDFSYDMKR